jgi:Radical SAM superfamily
MDHVELDVPIDVARDLCAGPMKCAVAKFGCVDGVDEEGDSIAGWAYDKDDSPAVIFVSYNEELYQIILADQYRADLKTAGLGSGCHAFTIPLPCDRSVFDPKLLEVRFPDGTEVKRSAPFLAWTDLDLLASPFTRQIALEFSSRCNLRCVYCAVSQPDYHGQDMEIGTDDFDELIRSMKARRVELISVHGHGETTLVPGWHHWINALAEAGFRLCITTNFARLLTSEELAAMARISLICVSIDTHRPEVLRKIRRHVSMGNILINMAKTTAKAVELGLPKPVLRFNCVVTDQTALDLLDLVRFGLSCRVKHYHLCNLVKYPDVEGAEAVDHVTTLPNEPLQKFARMLDEVRQMVYDAGGELEIATGLTDTLYQEMTARGLH